jgi:hypothetical protein
MRALNRHGERVFNPDRKDTHWGGKEAPPVRPRSGARGSPVPRITVMRMVRVLGSNKNIAKHNDAFQRVFALAVQHWSRLGSDFLGDESNAQSRDLGGHGHCHCWLL